MERSFESLSRVMNVNILRLHTNGQDTNSLHQGSWYWCSATGQIDRLVVLLLREAPIEAADGYELVLPALRIRDKPG
jgi:hypothetical protein